MATDEAVTSLDEVGKPSSLEASEHGVRDPTRASTEMDPSDLATVGTTHGVAEPTQKVEPTHPVPEVVPQHIQDEQKESMEEV